MIKHVIVKFAGVSYKVKADCHRCHGRGFIGKLQGTETLLGCRCARKLPKDSEPVEGEKHAEASDQAAPAGC